MNDALYVLDLLGALILAPCLVCWVLGHITGTEGRRRK